MKSQTRKTWITLLASCLLICAMTLVMFIASAPSQAKADGVTLGETKFSVSQDEDSIIFVTPIVADATEIAKIYEVGYTFDGEQPNVVNGQTNKYYTSLVTGGNALTAADIFGGTYEETTPMIIWEVERSDSTVYSATAYYKQGTVIEGTLYKDYNNVPDVAVNGTAKTTAVYEQIKSVDRELSTFLNDLQEDVSLTNYRTMNTNVSEVETKLATLSDVQKSKLTNLDEYENRTNYTVIDDMVGGDINNRVLVSGTKNNGFYNGETHPNSTAFKPMCLKEPYGYCSRITLCNGDNIQLRYETTGLDLSDYNFVYIGIINESNATATWKYTSTGRTLATIPNNSGFATIALTVSEFMNIDNSGTGCLYTADGTSGSIWFTPIIAVKSVSVIEDEISSYLTTLGDAKISAANQSIYADTVSSINSKLAVLSDADKQFISNLDAYNAKKFIVIDDMIGADIVNRVIVGGPGFQTFHNGETHPNSAFKPMCLKDPYGYCARIQKNAGGMITVKYQTDGLDLSGYNYVLLGAINEDTVASEWYYKDVKELASIAAGEFGTIKLTVEEFMNMDPETGNGFVNYYSGANIWITTIIAVAE